MSWSALPSSSSFVSAAKFSLSFLPRPAIELTALDAHPVTLIRLLLLGVVLLLPGGGPDVVAPLSERPREALESGRDVDLLSEQDLGRVTGLMPLATLSPSESLEAGVELDDRIDRSNACEPNLKCSNPNDVELLSYIYQTRTG